MPKSSPEGSSPRLRSLKLAWVYAAGLSVPFLLSVLWHSLNREYPKWDSLDYVNAALPVYRALKTYGWDSIGQVYWVRGWKPTLLPPLLLPFLLPTGDVRLSIALFNLFVFSIFLFFIARFLRLYLSDTAAILACWLIGTLPWVTISSYYFMTELPFLACGMAAVFYLFRRSFESPFAGVWLGFSVAVALCLQPFVTLITIMPICGLFAVRAAMTGHIQWSDIAAILVMAGAAVLLPMFIDCSNGLGNLFRLLSLWCALSGVGFYLCARRTLTVSVFMAAFVTLTIPLLWFAPFYRTMFRWAFECSIGAFGKDLTPWYAGGSFLTRVVHSFGGYFLGTLLLLAAASWFLRRHQRNSLPEKINLLAGSAILLTLSIGAAKFSYNYDVRYHYFGFTFLYMVLVVLIAGRHVVGERMVKLLLILVCFGHGLWTVNAFAGELDRHPWLDFYYREDCYERSVYWRGHMPTLQKDMSRTLLDAVARAVDLHRGVRVLGLLDTSAGFPEVGNLAVIAAERGDAATFDSLGFTYVPGAVSFGSNWQAGEYLIVGFPGSAKVPSTSSVSADLIGECLKQICLLGRYDAAGLEFIKKVDVPEINAALYVLRVRDASKFPFKSAEEFRRATASASAKK